MPVVDASVWVALFKEDEAGHAECRTWLNDQIDAGSVFSIPSIALPEVAAAIARGVGNDLLARQAAELLRERSLTEIHTVDEQLATRASEVARQARIRGCDAVYVALAAKLHKPLVTLDGQQGERGASVVDVQSPLSQSS